jgi:TPR repeat protein
MKFTHIVWLSLLMGCHRSESPSPRANQPINVAGSTPSCGDATGCERACQTGASWACVEAGRLYEYGHAGPRDPVRAFPLYERSCTLGNASGCFNAAILLEVGRGTAKDARRAAALYQQVCRMGSHTGCKREEDLSSVLSRADP